MKKIFLSLLVLCGLTLVAQAADLANIKYKNIKAEDKLKIVNDVWTDKVKRSDSDYFIKFVSDGSGSYSEFYNSDGSFAFNTGCQYEFIKNGDLIGYSNQDLKFYDFTYSNGELSRRELTEEEIKTLFPDYEIIKISEFAETTNSFKVKKDKLNFKIILSNDTDRNFYHYGFSTGNSKIEKYPLSGFLNIKKRGMIQFSHFGDNTKDNPWFVLLVR